MTPQVSAEKQYEFVTSQIDARINGSLNALKQFVQLFSAIVGGSIWLNSETKIPAMWRGTYVALSDFAVDLLCVMTLALVVANLQSWRRYRVTQCELVGKDLAGNYYVPLPTMWPSAWIEMGFLVAVALASVAFISFNPFELFPN